MAGQRGWGSNAHLTTTTVYGPHPWSERELGIDTVYSLDISGQSPMDRREDNSPNNGSRAMGDLGPLQRFNNIVAGTTGRIPVQPSSLPTSNGGATSANPILDLIANTNP